MTNQGKRFFYLRLAITNLRKNALLYVPYLLTGGFMAATFYIMLYIVRNKAIDSMEGGRTLAAVMVLGTIVIGLFSVVILLYTNSFLMKRRKKEIGLFNILGMGKRHIGKMMCIETILIGILSIAGGLAVGILLSKLLLVLLLRVLNFSIPFGFEVSPVSVLVTVFVFSCIYLITLLTNLRRVHVAKPIELLYGGQQGEKEPKVKWPVAVIGLLTLGTGYTIAVVIKAPLQALMLFFVAVILVIIGTYCLFTSGSIAVLKILKKNKKYFYQTEHFTNVSGMLYRMKKNAVGLGNICILATMVLVMLSGTTSLFIGLEDEIRVQYPREIAVVMSTTDANGFEELTAEINEALKESNAKTVNSVCYYYKRVSGLVLSGTEFCLEYGDALLEEEAVINFITLEMYNKMQGASETLEADEVMIYVSDGNYSEAVVGFGGKEYRVKETLSELNVQYDHMIQYSDEYYIILPDEETLLTIITELYGEKIEFYGYMAYYGFDVNGDEEECARISDAVEQRVYSTVINSVYPASFWVRKAASYRDEFLQLYGGLFFLGVFLGIVFIMATVLIMYYKQISEGFEDKERFEIMQKVGMSRTEVRKTIRSQVLSVFFLPLICACIHVGFAFPMLTRVLKVLNLINTSLFLACTAGTVVLFSVIYAAVYALTARAYYKIVS